MDLLVRHLYISPGHNFFGHHGAPPGELEMSEVPSVRCVAGRGLEGDRFLDFKPDYKGQITFFSWEVFQELCAALRIPDKPPSVLRRNVIVEGGDLNDLIDREFELQGVRFFGTQECKPCYWMDEAFGPGAEAAMQGRGGLRARIMTDGVLKVTSSAAAPAHA
jgi:MOSC domain-containing protein YiiM